LGLSLIGLFCPPELSEFALFLWLTFFAVLTRISITLFHVPHMSLGAELSSDFHERTEIAAYRYFFGYFGHLLTYFIGFYIFFADSAEFPRGQFNTAAYVPFSITLAIIVVVTMFYSARGTQSRVPFLVQPEVAKAYAGVKEVLRQTVGDLVAALHSVAFRWLFSGALIIYMMVGVDNALNLHMNTYFWELKSEGNLLFFLASPVGAIIGAFFARGFNQRFGKKPSIVIGTLWWAMCQIIPVVLRLLGWFPENGTTELITTLTLVKFVQGFGVVQALITFSSMLADIADEHELRTGKRQEGIFFATVSFSNKVTSGLGSVVAGFALTLIAWPVGAEIRTAADVPTDTLVWLGLLYGPIVSGFALICVYCYSRYDLDEDTHRQTLEALEVARAERASG
jgi:GPH family glycoside/pentoside/hexuronide:cation symporter